MVRRIRQVLERVAGRLRIKPIPVWYEGVRFASTLEADWAATFDEYGITWSYEPMAVRLSDGQVYRCDFWLKAQRVWFEVKGPHDLRIDKPWRLWEDVGGDAFDRLAPLVLIGREPEGCRAVVERADGGRATFTCCNRCENYTFVDLEGAWQCRVCGYWQDAEHWDVPIFWARVFYPQPRERAA
jgi:hypothetical protein